MKKIIFLYWVCLLHSFALPGQVDSTSYDFGDFGGIIYLDSLVVTASRSGFDVDDFVDMVRADKSFYRAFRNLRFLSYRADNEIRMYNKKGINKAAYESSIRQEVDGLCRMMKLEEEKNSGNFYKRKKKYRYYTAKLYDRLFFTWEEVCEPSREANEFTGAKGMDKHIRELKKLIFQPGSKADVPIIGNRTAIFDPDMVPFYDFAIKSVKYQGQQDCYVFTASVKAPYLEKKEGKTIIKFLETYFDKSNFQVLARNYQLSYNGALFDFDVTMKIKLHQVQGQYVPEYINYDGSWDVPGKKPEISKFQARFYDFD